MEYSTKYVKRGTFEDKYFVICTFLFRLAEVGVLEPVKIDGNYDTGQMFLHRLFGYRGVILFPWMARVFDRDAQNTKKSEE